MCTCFLCLGSNYNDLIGHLSIKTICWYFFRMTQVKSLNVVQIISFWLVLDELYARNIQSISYSCQWRIQEFQNGGARSRRGTIFRSGVCFDAPSNIPYVFVARVVNKIHNINIVNWVKSKYMRVIQSKFTTPNPNFFQNGGGGGAPVLDPPLYNDGYIFTWTWKLHTTSVNVLYEFIL